VAGRAAGRASPPEVVQYMPCIVRADRGEAQRAARLAVGEMLPAYWTLGQRLPAAKAALTEGSGISEAEFAAAAERLKAGEPASAVLDDRHVAAFALAGTAQDCRAQAETYGRAGVTELALTFGGDSAAADMAALARAMAG
jgi:5,10-methylenetetrahydromethanopterin reductase